MKTCIVIPIYNQNLSRNEYISFLQAIHLFSKYDIFIIQSEDIAIEYPDLVKKLVIPKEHLLSRKSYSRYVLSLEFYNLFQDYDYMLIYQLDAFVFEDKLLEFCELGYDYIGAPWIYGLECHVSGYDFIHVGNGGLSLRKVSSFIKWIEEKRADVSKKAKYLLEDQVIGTYGTNFLKIAPVDIALKFAFDLNPEDCYKANNYQLPFGCHAWNKFGKEFWKEHIDKIGYDVEIENNKLTQSEAILCEGKRINRLFKKCFKKELVNLALKKIISDYDGHIIVFGAGNYGIAFANLIKDTGIIIEAFIDNDVEKIGDNLFGIPILASKSVELVEKYPILIALATPDSAIEQLEKMNLVMGKQFSTSKKLQHKMMSLSSNDSHVEN